MERFDSHRKMSTISSTSVLSFLTWSRLATVTIGTYWSLSIWEMRYMSLARFSLRGRGGLFSGEHISLRCHMTQHLLSIKQGTKREPIWADASVSYSILQLLHT